MLQLQTSTPHSVDLVALSQTEFAREDVARAGCVDSAQFRRALGQVALRLRPDRLPGGPWFDALFSKLDGDCDGLLSFSDFDHAVSLLHAEEFHRRSDEWRAYADRCKQGSRTGEPLEVSAEALLGWSSAGPPTSLYQAYEVVAGGHLGEGAFGKVMQVRHFRTGAVRACKAVPLDSQQARELVELEVSLLKSLDHVSLLRLYEVFLEGSTICLVTELCEGGALAERLAYHREALGRPMPEGQVAGYLEQILGAAGYCHQRGVVHRDLKPENVLFVGRAASSPLKIIDFGLAETFERLHQSRRTELVERDGALGAVARFLPRLPDGDELISTQVARVSMQRAGTPHYMAPEVYQGEYGPTADIFSIGCMAFEMLSGHHPFYVPNVDNLESVRHKILHEEANFELLARVGLSSFGVHICRRMLEQSPRKRLSAQQALTDSWFASLSHLAQRGALSLTHENVCNALLRFASGSRLRQVVLRVLTRELTELQVRELRDAFLHMDRDGDGVLSLGDLSAKSHAGAEVQAALGQVGTCAAKARGIGYTDFLAMLLPQRITMRPEQLACAFEHLDIRCQGRLGAASLSEAIRAGGQGYSSISPALLAEAAAELGALWGGAGMDLLAFCRLAQVAAEQA